MLLSVSLWTRVDSVSMAIYIYIYIFFFNIDQLTSAMFHLLGIERLAVTMSITTLDGGFKIHAAPHFPSYIPGMSLLSRDLSSFQQMVCFSGSMAQFGDRMTFWQRLQNTISYGLLHLIFTQIQAKANPIFNELVPGFEVVRNILLSTVKTKNAE